MQMIYKFRLNPTRHQQSLLNNTLELCRWVYNETLATRKNAWDDHRKSTSYYDTKKMIPLWKKEKPELFSVYSQVLQNVTMRVDFAFKSFFRRVKLGEKPGYPRFRGRGRYNSFTYPQKGFTLCDHKLLLSKIGGIKIIKHRPIEGNIKTLNVYRDTTGNWYACFACEIKRHPLSENKKVIGLDVGLTSFATLSTGEKIDNPRFFRRDEKELIKAQRNFSKEKKGTQERKKRRKAVSHIHQRIFNRRSNFAHKFSRNLINEYGMIAIEKLNIEKMLKNHHLSKSISDAAWNQFARYIQYKAENAGRQCVLVDPSNTSKQCSCCGVLVEKNLSVRVHSCPSCGLTIDRDKNAAMNILALGLQCLDKSPRSP